MRNIDKLKLYLKEKINTIRGLKRAIPELRRSGKASWREQSSLASAKRDYRHHHIAYCELRGRTRKQIEPKVRENNEPNERLIREIKDKYAWSPEEIASYQERKAKNENVRATA